MASCAMGSRERQLRAMRREEVDYVPLLVHFWSPPVSPRRRLERERERLRTHEALGLDKEVSVGGRSSRSREVSDRVWQTKDAGLGCALLHKEFRTPAGPLSAVVRRTDDWPWGDDVPLLDDFNPPRFVKPWVESLEDVERLRYVLQPARGKDRDRMARETREGRDLARAFDAVLTGGGGHGLDFVCWLCGFEQAVMLALERPEVVAGLMAIETELAVASVSLLCEMGVDRIERRGCYETADFWSPELYRRFARPSLEVEIRAAHAYDCPVVYWMLSGVIPLLPQLREIPFDLLLGAEPGRNGQAQRRIAQELDGLKAFQGGISPSGHLTATPDVVRRAVQQAFEAYGYRGFILGASGSIRPYYPRENVEALIDEWKRRRVRSE